MADGTAEPIRLKERRPIKAAIEPEQPGPDGLPATLAISTATVTLKTRPPHGVGTVVGSIQDTPVDSYTSGASIKPEALYRVRPLTLGIPIGAYVANFIIDCTNGDRFEVVVDFDVVGDDDSP